MLRRASTTIRALTRGMPCALLSGMIKHPHLNDRDTEIISIPPTRSPRWRAWLRAFGVRQHQIRRCAAGRREGQQILAERDRWHTWVWNALPHQ